MRILFWGTASFALPSLRVLAEAGHEVVGVVTQPDRPAGRSRRPRATLVKQAALACGYPVLTPDRPGRAGFLKRARELAPELSVVAAYGRFLSREALDLPGRGSINVHASLLPELRGAAPVNWAIARDHEATGVTIMRMVEAMDAGPVLHQETTTILPEETASELYGRLAEVGGTGLARTLELMERGPLEERPQDHSRATFAPLLSREGARVEWARPAREVARWIRAMDAIPGAWSELEGASLKLFRPRVEAEETTGEPVAAEPGTVIAADPRRGLRVAAGEGSVTVGEVQPAGKRRMPARDWLRGRLVRPGQRLR